MGNHLGSWVGQPWAEDAVGKLWKDRNKLASWLLCWAPWSSIHPTPYFPFIWTNKFSFLWRQTLLSFLLLQWISSQLTQLQFHGAPYIWPYNSLYYDLCLSIIASWPITFMFLTSNSRNEICWLNLSFFPHQALVIYLLQIHVLAPLSHGGWPGVPSQKTCISLLPMGISVGQVSRHLYKIQFYTLQ